jgi:DNA modification methylase
MVGQPEQKRNGPKNILNDLDYKTWLQFQKSFERFKFNEDNLPTNFARLVDSYILFFTKKEVQGRTSSVLTNITPQKDANREIIELKGDPLTRDWINKAQSLETRKLDYVILKTQCLERNKGDVANDLFSWLSHRLKENAYSTIFCVEKNSSYPAIWEFANASRTYLQLSDEKILLDENKGMQTLYALQFRNSIDKIPPKPFNHEIATAQSDFPKYIIPKPPPRKKDEVVHPAKFPEQLIKEFIKAFTQENDWVLDIMAGTGSALIAAYETRRNSVGIELDLDFFKIAKKRLMKVNPPTRLPGFAPLHVTDIIHGDARNAKNLLSEYQGKFSYCVTSPPYWNMLHNSGSEGQRARRNKNLRLTYSESEFDVGNIHEYQRFIATLRDLYEKVEPLLEEDGKLTVITKNVKQEGFLYTLAWDLVDELSGENGRFNFLGYTLWCQDDVPLKPFAIGHHWVSNILHHYCLHFGRRKVG